MRDPKERAGETRGRRGTKQAKKHLVERKNTIKREYLIILS